MIFKLYLSICNYHLKNIFSVLNYEDLNYASLSSLPTNESYKSHCNRHSMAKGLVPTLVLERVRAVVQSYSFN